MDRDAVGHDGGRDAELEPSRPGGLDLGGLDRPEDEDSHVRKRLTQLERLGDRGDAECRRAGVERRGPDRHGSVPVPVCLDDGPELGPTREAGAEQSRVVPDRREVDRDE